MGSNVRSFVRSLQRDFMWWGQLVKKKEEEEDRSGFIY
jgi:hypothetical protein